MENIILGDLLSDERGISVGVMYPGEHSPEGVPLIRSADLEGDRISSKPTFRISSTVHEEYRRTELVGGELLMSLVGNVGRCAVVPASMKGWNAARAIAVMRFKDADDAHFIRFALKSPNIRHLIDVWSNTTVQQTLNLKEIRRLPIPWPSTSERRQITAVLRALDDKIDLNRSMNATLEATAQAIFKDWFVDFGPTRAKMEMRSPYLAPETWARFPDLLDDNGKPETWGVSTVGVEFNLTMGQSPPGDTYNSEGDGLPFFQGRTDFGARYPKRRIFCNAPTRLAAPDDTLVSVRAPVGDLNMAWERCCVGRGVAAVRHQSGNRSYTYYAIAQLQPELEAFEHTGTVFGAINKAQFERIAILAPSRQTVDAFEQSVFALDERIRCNEAEIDTLVGMRDLLLPKLMSGKIRVKEAEEIAEGSL